MKTIHPHIMSLIFSIGLIGAGGCSTDKPEPMKKTESKAAESQANIVKSGKASPTGDEGANIPTRVAGSYLTCALRKEATDADLSQQYGCFLADSSTGTKIDQDPNITWKSSAESGVEFFDPDSDYTLALYNILLVVNGSTKAEIDAKVQSTDIIPMYGLQSILVKRLYNVLKPAYDIKDYDAPIVRDQSIEPDRNAPPTDPFYAIF